MSGNVSYIRGNIFTSGAQSLVNTVNCVGVMGAGIALEFRYRYPEMFNRYVEFCKAGYVQIGFLYIYDVPRTGRKVINFPTKRDWKHPSKREYLEKGLEKFLETYKEKGITSAAFPLLGAQNGGLDPVEVKELMTNYLERIDIPIEIYEYTTSAKDDLLQPFTEGILYNKKEFKNTTGLSDAQVEKLRQALSENDLNSLIQLTTVKGLGEETIKASFQFAMRAKAGNITEPVLFKAAPEPPETLEVKEPETEYGSTAESSPEALAKPGKAKKPGGSRGKAKKPKTLTLEEKQLLTNLPPDIILKIEDGNEDVTILDLKAYAAGMKLKVKKFVTDKYLG